MTPKDRLAFVGNPPLFRPQNIDEVHVSVTFTWDVKEGERLAEAWALYYPRVLLGGPVYGLQGDDFVPGRYVKEGVTFTTRGCNRKCPWCLVPGNEGKLREIEDFAPGWIVQDNNLLMASRRHMKRVFDMLREQPHPAQFQGGLDARLVDDWVADQLKDMKIKQLFLAADTEGAMGPLAAAIEKLSYMKHWQRRVFTMIGFGEETIEQAASRCERVWQMGGAPYAQLYQPRDHFIKYPREWKKLQASWASPAVMSASHGGWIP